MTRKPLAIPLPLRHVKAMTHSTGLHHVTALSGNISRTHDFYTRVLGLRCVKKTVNFDDAASWHLYYGDTTGSPGTLITFFSWEDTRAGQAGSGEAVAVSFAIPTGSAPYWAERLSDEGVRFALDHAAKAPVLALHDPDGLALELVEEETHGLTHPHVEEIAPEQAITGLVGAYLMLISVLLIARIPMIERVVAQDRLVAFHRKLGAWPLVLILIHMVLTIVGYAQRYSHTWYGEIWQMCTEYPGVLLAFVATALITLAGVTSYRIARRRLKYETWWIVHLYIYLALALSFPHQIATGTSFVGHPANRAWWIAIWIATAGVAILYRFLLPIYRS